MWGEHRMNKKSKPYQLDSLHALPEHAARIDAMAARLGELRPSWPGDSARTDEDPYE